MTTRSRVAILAVLLVVGVGLLLGMQLRDGRLGLVARCFVMGEGRAWLPNEARDFEADFYGMRFRGNTSRFLDAHVLLYGGYERHVLLAMRDAMHALAPPEDAVAVDVGANVGHHSMFLSQHAARVIAVEPFPPVVARMQSMLDDNSIDNVDVHALGYSNEPGTLPFHAPPARNDGLGSFTTFQGNEDAVLMELPLVRGDDDLADAGPIHLVKVDIEGFEKFAFEGLRDTLARWRPVVVFELNVTVEEGFHSEAELRGSLPDNYDFFLIDGGAEAWWQVPQGVVFCAPEEPHYSLVPFDMTFHRDQRNLLAMPHEHVDRLAHVTR